MKKIILVAMFLSIATMVFVNEASAQITFGANVGLNVSTLSSGEIKYQGRSQDFDAGDAAAGLYLSGFVNFSFTRVIGLQPELGFSMQGQKEKISSVDVTNRLNYINIPVLLDIKPVTNLSIFVGPQIGFNVYRGLKADNVTISGSQYDDYLESTYMKFNAVDFAAVIGVQYAIMGHFIVSTRFNIGFQPVYASDLSGLEISGSANQVFQIGVGYKF